MFLTQTVTNILVFLVGLCGFLTNRKSLLILLMCLELLLLAASTNFVLFSAYLDDAIGEHAWLLILTVAAAEAAIGLALVILFYKRRGVARFVAGFVLKH